MDFSMNRNSLDYYKPTGTLNARNEFSAEAVVPDTQPDIDRILCANANVLVHTKNALTGRVCLTGDVAVKALYVPEGEGAVCCLDFKLPFSVDLEVDCPGEILPVASVRAVALDVRMLNPRKVLARAELAAESRCYTRQNMCWYDAVEEAEHVFTRKASCTVKTPAYVTEKSFTISDELSVPSGKNPPERLLMSDVSLGVDDWSDVGGRLIIRGTAVSRVQYLAADGNIPQQAEFSTQYSQLIELPEGSMCGFEVVPMLTDAYMDVFTTAGGAKALSLEIHGVAQCVCFRETEIDYIDDAYSTKGALDITQTPVTAACGETEMLRANIRENVQLQRDASELLSVTGIPGVAAMSENLMQAPLALNIMYLDGDGRLCSEQAKIMAEAELDGTPPEWLSARLGTIDANISGGGLDMSVPVDFVMRRENTAEFNPVTAISLDDDSMYETPRPSVTVVRPDTDDMWSLAKRYRSCADTIMKCNGIEAGDSLSGKILLIPRA